MKEFYEYQEYHDYLDYLSEHFLCVNELPEEHWKEFKKYVEDHNLDTATFTYDDYLEAIQN